MTDQIERSDNADTCPLECSVPYGDDLQTLLTLARKETKASEHVLISFL